MTSNFMKLKANVGNRIMVVRYFVLLFLGGVCKIGINILKNL